MQGMEGYEYDIGSRKYWSWRDRAFIRRYNTAITISTRGNFGVL